MAAGASTGTEPKDRALDHIIIMIIILVTILGAPYATIWIHGALSG